MSTFSDQLKSYIDKKSAKISAVSKYCGYDRSTFYKILKGERNPPSLSLVKQICQFLNLTFDETANLTTTYYQTLLGEKTYWDFQNTMALLLSFSTVDATGIPFGQIRYEFDFEMSQTSYALNNTIELSNSLYHALLKCAEGNQKVKMILQPSQSLINESVVRLFTQLNLEVTHILCLSNRDNDLVPGADHYNINCLKQTLNFLTNLQRYDVFYYYDDAQARFNNHALFPFLLLTTDSAISFNANFDSGIYYSSNDIVRLYNNHVDQLLSNCLPLYRTISGITEQYLVFRDLINSFFVLEFEPCITSFVTEQMLANVILHDIDDREATINFLGDYIRRLNSTFINQNSYSYFTLSGLLYFAHTGRISIVPDDIYHPINIQDRIEILSNVLPYVKRGQFKIVKKELEKLDSHFHFSLHNETIAALYVKNSKGNLMISLLEEPKLFSIFKNFSMHIDIYDYVYSLEETLQFFDDVLTELKQMITTTS
ncbi:MAG: helix-turn-helix transcriptional regulator [Acetobacterium sp.]|nr:helix-turn-helix transcriptional regulator [Acetobacterium sp.]